MEALPRVVRSQTEKDIIKIWPLPMVDPWAEDWYKNEEWYNNWWKYHELPQQANVSNQIIENGSVV